MSERRMLGEATARLNIDASEIKKNITKGLQDGQEVANKNPIKYRLEVDQSTIQRQLKKDQATLFKELQDAYEKNSNLELDDIGFAKAVQTYVASGGKLTKEFERISVYYNELKQDLKKDFVPLDQIELFSNMVESVQKNVDFSNVDFSKLEKLNVILKQIFAGYSSGDISAEEFVAFVQDFEKQGGIFTTEIKEIKDEYDDLVS